jgi:hypothetical protein
MIFFDRLSDENALEMIAATMGVLYHPLRGAELPDILSSRQEKGNGGCASSYTKLCQSS